MRLRKLVPALALASFAALPTAAQSLRGSPASVDRMYREAQEHDLYFFRTPGGVRRAVERGDLVRMSGNSDYRVADASYPYVLPTTRTFVQRLGRQYRAYCGERLVVTSGARPRSFRLRNSVGDRSVHAAGMAVDLRKPNSTRCLAWLRTTLLAVEGRDAIEATEERRPPHFHVAVFPGPYRRYVAGMEGTKPRSESRAAARYRVREGDTLWAIARRNGITVARLKSANGLRSDRVRPGQTLVIPGR